MTTITTSDKSYSIKYAFPVLICLAPLFFYFTETSLEVVFFGDSALTSVFAALSLIMIIPSLTSVVYLFPVDRAFINTVCFGCFCATFAAVLVNEPKIVEKLNAQENARLARISHPAFSVGDVVRLKITQASVQILGTECDANSCYYRVRVYDGERHGYSVERFHEMELAR